MGTIDKPLTSKLTTMVPLVCLLVLVPLAACGSQEDFMKMMAQQYMNAKGWGNHQGGTGMTGGMTAGATNGQAQWSGAQNKDDYEAYLKWCEDRKIAIAEQEQQKALLEQFQKAQAEKQKEAQRARVEAENKEKRESMMAQWKMWQMRLSELTEFEDNIGKFSEMKHAYMFSITMEFLKFCKCSDFTEELERYFIHGGVSYKGGATYDLDDLNGIDMTNAVVTARNLANKTKVYQIKAFFGGMANALCQGARTYVEQVKQWEGQYHFLDKLL